MVRITPFMTPTRWSLVPKSVVSVMMGRAKVGSYELPGMRRESHAPDFDANGPLCVCQSHPSRLARFSNAWFVLAVVVYGLALESQVGPVARGSRGGKRQTRASPLGARIRLLRDEPDRPYAAMNAQLNARRRLPVLFVHIGASVLLQAAGAHRSDSAGRIHVYAHVSRQVDRCLSDTALDRPFYVGLSFAAQVEVELARAHMDFQIFHIHAVEPQAAVARTHLHMQIKRDIVCQVHIPLVVLVSKMCVPRVLILFYTQLSAAARDRVVDIRLSLARGIPELRVHQMARASCNRQLPRRYLQIHVRRRRSL